MAGLPFARYLVSLEYVGTGFSGAALNAHAPLPTVAGELLLAVGRLPLAVAPKLALSSRTDAGVHALLNTVHLDLWRAPREPSTASGGSAGPASALRLAASTVLSRPAYGSKELKGALNAFLPETINVRRVVMVPRTLHARYGVGSREYVYRVQYPLRDLPRGVGVEHLHDGGTADVGEMGVEQSPRKLVDGWSGTVLEPRRSWYVPYPLDLGLLKREAQGLVGTHDFTTFRGSGCSSRTPVKTIDRIEVSDPVPSFFGRVARRRHRGGADHDNVDDVDNDGDDPAAAEIEVVVRGRGFMYNQVRLMVAALVGRASPGTGKAQLLSMAELLEGRSRSLIPWLAPPHGLYLADVFYPELADSEVALEAHLAAIDRISPDVDAVVAAAALPTTGVVGSLDVDLGTRGRLRFSAHETHWSCVLTATPDHDPGTGEHHPGTGEHHPPRQRIFADTFPAPVRVRSHATDPEGGASVGGWGLPADVVGTLLRVVVAEDILGSRLMFPNAPPSHAVET